MCQGRYRGFLGTSGADVHSVSVLLLLRNSSNLVASFVGYAFILVLLILNRGTGYLCPGYCECFDQGWFKVFDGYPAFVFC